MSRAKRIGILGGTFNPIHKGHLVLGAEAVKKLRLDKLFFVPAYIPPHKKMSVTVSARERAAMVRMAIRGNSVFSLSLFEVSRRKRSYSIQTLRYFRRRFGTRTQIVFILGADSLKGISMWKDINKLLRICRFAVFARPGYALCRCKATMTRFQIRALNVSSSEIRSLLKKGRSVRALIPENVYAYIKKKGLYNT